MTKKEIVQALRCCAEGDCKDCDMHEDMLGAASVTRPALICRRMGSAPLGKEDNKWRS